ncbi:uncharacterized protein DUF4166 [Cytobacillus horneckiae]|uniref:DUF4166 domain-containing protein n=1 Tax=Cytobacillus horneckiae TaxID=549687 RepID=A0A2N0Z9A9_9BACI|nr:DUF4166 domain-containing protein [Cytobacillus horneckiae]MBN6886576.1 DUF4166 domain-containing protein [Cytobacillus horneckiae]MCM3177955.1 DUF4166 domain-containing protein [Cytobacillus horneckiae]MEC1159205.1 DUF4166 domain-containing protein [Cytobacillus horneckiae]MED2935892.1 DUF4166 domain-containing protein [Cytobacillus horneckiae]PKG26105.1 DUF4166 domain-containing protein [Cytobacillus horneckiae]
MSIYKSALGEDFKHLHPMLQKRYSFIQQTFIAKGKMRKIIHGASWLKPLLYLGIRRKLLFPEQGVDIPFQITNRSINTGNDIYWERIFYFHGKARYFNATMSLNDASGIVQDYLGDPAVIYSDLHFYVMDDGSLLISSGKQRLVLGKLEIPMPRWFQGIAEVREKYIEESKQFHINVHVKNPIIGLIFAYEGEFTYE